MTMPDVSGLPENLDATNPDDPANPTRKQHQQHHDLLHAAVKALLPRSEASATYATAVAVDAIDDRVVTLESAPGGGGSTVTLDADGTLVVDGTTVEVATDAQLTAGLATKASLTGATYTGTHDFTGATVTGVEAGGAQAAGATLLRLAAPDGGLWDLTAANDGVPVTTAAPVGAADGTDALRLVSPDGTLYAYTVANDGVLTFAEVV